MLLYMVSYYNSLIMRIVKFLMGIKELKSDEQNTIIIRINGCYI